MPVLVPIMHIIHQLHFAVARNILNTYLLGYLPHLTPFLQGYWLIEINWRGECKTMLSDDLGEKKKLLRKGLNFGMWASLICETLLWSFFCWVALSFWQLTYAKKLCFPWPHLGLHKQTNKLFIKFAVARHWRLELFPPLGKVLCIGTRQQVACEIFIVCCSSIRSLVAKKIISSSVWHKLFIQTVK